MTRVLPAHVVAASAVVGLACANLVRVAPGIALALAAAVALVVAVGDLPPAAAAGAWVVVLASAGAARGSMRSITARSGARSAEPAASWSS